MIVNRSGDFHIRIWGEYGLFTRPETKAEPASYDIITPSAAVGVLDAIMWHPGMIWVPTAISILSPIQFMNFRRNDVKNKPSGKHYRGAPYIVNDMRSQRNRLLVRKPDYAVVAHIQMVPEKAGPDDNIMKFVNMFTARMKNGQSFYEPFLGTSEFPARVAYYEGDPVPQPINEDFGMMQLGGWVAIGSQPRFFRAVAVDGVVTIGYQQGVAK